MLNAVRSWAFILLGRGGGVWFGISFDAVKGGSAGLKSDNIFLFGVLVTKSVTFHVFLFSVQMPYWIDPMSALTGLRARTWN